MSYVVLARKYRSNDFSEMVGQGHVVQALQNALTSGRLHHAYLFTGTRGVGKTTVSRILAKSLNCVGRDGQGGITAKPCGVCHACRDITQGRFVDYTELDAASNRGVDEIQALLEQAVYKPVVGRFKVFMIDEVHMLSNTAFNAMLKTLEEPPEYLKFVLATTDPKKVPVTVLSRCLQFNLRPMAPETIADHLHFVLAQEAVSAEEQAIKMIARAARGSMRDALSLTDQAIAYGDGQLLAAQVQHMLGAADRAQVFKLLGALAAGDGAQVFAGVQALREEGLSAAAALEDMVTVLQRMGVLQLAGVALHDDEPEIADLAAKMPIDETQLLYSMCLNGRAELGLSPDEYSGLTMVLLRLLAFKGGGVAPAASVQSTRVQGVPVQSELVRASAGTAATPASGSMGGAAAPSKKPERSNGSAPAARTEPRVESELPEAERVAVAPQFVQGPPTQSERLTSAEKVPFVHDSRHLNAINKVAADGPISTEISKVSTAEVLDAALPTEVLSHLGDLWADVVATLCANEWVSALPRELALQSMLVSQSSSPETGASALLNNASDEPAGWHLQVASDALNQSATRERLQAALLLAGHQVRLSVTTGVATGTPSQRLQAAQAARQNRAEAVVHGDPYVQSLLRDFGGVIVPGTLKYLVAPAAVAQAPASSGVPSQSPA